VPGASAGGADADAGEVEFCLVLAAGDGGVDDDLQVGVAVAEHVAVYGDIPDTGMTDGLAVLGVPADPGYTATDLNRHSGTQTVTEGTDAIVTLATEDPSAGTGRFVDRFGPVAW